MSARRCARGDAADALLDDMGLELLARIRQPRVGKGRLLGVFVLAHLGRHDLEHEPEAATAVGVGTRLDAALRRIDLAAEALAHDDCLAP